MYNCSFDQIASVGVLTSMASRKLFSISSYHQERWEADNETEEISQGSEGQPTSIFQNVLAP